MERKGECAPANMNERELREREKNLLAIVYLKKNNNKKNKQYT